MKYIKIFEEYENDHHIDIIDSLCRKLKLKKYTINDDLSVDVNGDVFISGTSRMYEFPIKFGFVNGSFDCSNNLLTTLKGAPKRIKGTFQCQQNLLTSLEYIPEGIEGYFNCFNNKLTSLEFCPQSIEGLCCSDNKLTSLLGCPQKSFTEGFDCSWNSITTLEYGPTSVYGEFDITRNPIYTFEYFPDLMGGSRNIPYTLELLVVHFDFNYDLLGAFNEYNIIKKPIDDDSKPRIKISNFNKFLKDFNLKEIVLGSNEYQEIIKYYDVK